MKKSTLILKTLVTALPMVIIIDLVLLFLIFAFNFGLGAIGDEPLLVRIPFWLLDVVLIIALPTLTWMIFTDAYKKVKISYYDQSVGFDKASRAKIEKSFRPYKILAWTAFLSVFLYYLAIYISER